jgi:hypothetical protein
VGFVSLIVTLGAITFIVYWIRASLTSLNASNLYGTLPDAKGVMVYTGITRILN